MHNISSACGWVAIASLLLSGVLLVALVPVTAFYPEQVDLVTVSLMTSFVSLVTFLLLGVLFDACD